MIPCEISMSKDEGGRRKKKSPDDFKTSSLRNVSHGSKPRMFLKDQVTGLFQVAKNRPNS